MNNLMNVIKEELERTNGKLEYKEQVHSILIKANVELSKIDYFIKNVLKKRKSLALEIIVDLMDAGWSKESSKEFVNMVLNTELKSEIMERSADLACYFRMQMLDINGDRKKRVKAYLIEDGVNEDIAEKVVNINKDDVLNEEIRNTVDKYFSSRLGVFSTVKITENKELYRALGYKTDEYYNEEFKQVICLKCGFPKEICKC